MQKKKSKGLLWGILLLLSAVLLVGVVLYTQGMFKLPNRSVQEASEEEAEDDEEVIGASSGDADTSGLEKWQEGIVSYNGKNYKFNTNLHIYLMMGIDNDHEVEISKDHQSGGQSDAMFLLIADTEKMQLSVVAINRNTMTKIYVTNAAGEHLSDIDAQICLQHAYGDGKKLSCTRARDAVSYLFYNLPINGYFAINMGGIPAFNDALGGVTVKSLQDLSYPDDHVELKKGQEYNLMGMEAYYYLRGRDINEFASADQRLARQKQYIDAYLKKAKEDGSVSAAASIYNSVSDYLVTDVNFQNVLSELMEYDYDWQRMYDIPGETTQSDVYEEYWVDEEKFYEMNLDLFYTEVN